jgi:hypothetical protein
MTNDADLVNFSIDSMVRLNDIIILAREKKDAK